MSIVKEEYSPSMFEFVELDHSDDYEPPTGYNNHQRTIASKKNPRTKSKLKDPIKKKQLALLIQNETCIWNVRDVNYSNQTFISAAWARIAEELDFNGGFVTIKYNFATFKTNNIYFEL